MVNESYCIKVPGKLMIAGEYAVLEPKQKSVVIAVNRYMTAHIAPAEENRISLPKLGLEDITWEISNGKIKFNIEDSRLNFVENSIFVAAEFLKEKEVELTTFELKIESELDDSSTGEKYGLGSSAAVVTSIISAILGVHSGETKMFSLSNDIIFKLSAIAHLRSQKSGSGADIAAAVYGGWIKYSAFMSEWILEELEKGVKISELVEKTWPNLSIKSITIPKDLKLAVGWTKSSASTSDMIKRIKAFKALDRGAYNEFLIDSLVAVNRLVRAFEENDCKEAIASIQENRRALQKLGEAANVDIETLKLKDLCSIADEFGGGKPSGAGGGDCGIAFLEGNSYIEELTAAWEEADIKYLDLKVSEHGVSIEGEK